MKTSESQSPGIWEEALGFIQARMGDEVIETWFQPTKLGELNGKKATIVVPNKFFGEWLGRNYREVIGEALQAVRPVEGGRVEERTGIREGNLSMCVQ